MPKPFTLTDKVLLEHRAGQALCLAPSARGRSFAFAAARPAGFDLFRAGRLEVPMAPEGDEPPPSSEQPSLEPQVASPSVAVIRLRGLLQSEVEEHMCGFADGYEGEGGIVDRIRGADASADVGAIVVDSLCPGGDALGCGEAAAQLAALQAQTIKPILVFAREANSAAYWLTAAVVTPGCFFVSDSSDVGCIGSWNGHADESVALELAGVKIKLFEYPPGKTAGNGFEPLSEEGAARFQASAMEHGSRFVASIAALRGLTPEAIVAFRGRSFRGAAAITAGLADGTAGSLDEVIALAATMAANPTARGTTMAASAPRPAPPASTVSPKPANAAPNPAGPAGPDDAPPQFAEGDKVKIVADDVVGTVTSTDVYEVTVDGEDMPRRCMGNELELQEAAAAPAAAQSRAALPRAFAASIVRASRLAPGASDAAARTQAAGLLGLAAAVLEATGKSDPEAALGVLHARFAAAAQVPELKRRLTAKNTAADADERAKLLTDAVALGVKPALLYDVTEGPETTGPDGAKVPGKKVKSESAWTKGQSTAQLLAFVATTRELGGFGLTGTEQNADTQAAGQADALALTPDQLAYCKQRGLDPAKFASLLPKQNGAPATAQG